MNATTFRYITDALTKDEALEMLKAKETTKKEREEKVRKVGSVVLSLLLFSRLYTYSSIYCCILDIPPTSHRLAGWVRLPLYDFISVCRLMLRYNYSLGYSDDKVSKLMKAAVARGFTHFKMKVGTNRFSDLRRGKLIRSIIDDPQYFPDSRLVRDPEHSSLEGKNAGGTGSVLMMDANQVWDVEDAIEWTKGLAEIKPWYASLPPLCYASMECLQPRFQVYRGADCTR